MNYIIILFRNKCVCVCGERHTDTEGERDRQRADRQKGETKLAKYQKLPNLGEESLTVHYISFQLN